MKKRDCYYMHQQFLMTADIRAVSLPYISDQYDSREVQDFRDSPNLFDTEARIVRKVKLSYILEEIDTQSDWDFFMQQIQFVDILLLVIDTTPSPLPVLQQYYEETLKAIVVLFSDTNTSIVFIENGSEK